MDPGDYYTADELAVLVGTLDAIADVLMDHPERSFAQGVGMVLCTLVGAVVECRAAGSLEPLESLLNLLFEWVGSRPVAPGVTIQMAVRGKMSEGN